MDYPELKNLVTPPISHLLAVIRRAGGRSVLVGGCVRDALMGYAPKDVDIEVYGLPPAALQKAIAPHARVFAVGVSFGVLKVYLADGLELDVSIPRRDSRPGELGDLGVPDPTTTPQEAASRRDFTVNAMAFDPATSDLLDYYGGQADLANHILRHVGPAFAHDPLRVLRGMQFAARWDFRLDPQTATFCQTLLPAYGGLARERVWGEWHKLARKGVTPSAGLRVLAETGWRGLYPPLASLAERGLWDATALAMDRAVGIAGRDGLDGEARTVLLLATLAHAFAPGEAEEFMSAIGSPLAPARQVVNLTRERLTYQAEPLSDRAVRYLAYRLQPVEFARWAELVEATDPTAPAQEWLATARRLGYESGQVRPLLLGRHLQEAGLTPGQHYKVLLDAALRAQLDGEFDTVEGAQAWLAQQ